VQRAPESFPGARGFLYIQGRSLCFDGQEVADLLGRGCHAGHNIAAVRLSINGVADCKLGTAYPVSFDIFSAVVDGSPEGCSGGDKEN